MPTQPSDRELVAFHEAGHAVAHAVLRRPFRYVTLEPFGPAEAHLHAEPLVSVPAFQHKRAESLFSREIRCVLAGTLAMWHRAAIPDSAPTDPEFGGGWDFEEAERLVRFRFAAIGQDDPDRGELRDYLRNQQRETLDLLLTEWTGVERVADALLHHTRLSATTVRAIVRRAQRER